MPHIWSPVWIEPTDIYDCPGGAWPASQAEIVDISEGTATYTVNLTDTMKEFIDLFIPAIANINGFNTISKINIETEYCNPPEYKTFNETPRQIYLSWNQDDWPEPVLQGFMELDDYGNQSQRRNLTAALGIKKNRRNV